MRSQLYGVKRVTLREINTFLMGRPVIHPMLLRCLWLWSPI